MANKNEIVEATEKMDMVVTTYEQLSDFVGEAIGTSPLMEGTKFSSDELIAADVVILRDVDWVDYIQDEGEPSERAVHFSIWSVEVDGEKGYYQAGTVFNKIARALERNPSAYQVFRENGLRIKCTWGQTSSKNKIVLVSVVV